VGRQALEIDHRRYAADVERLQAELEALLGTRGARPHVAWRRKAWAAAGVVGLAVLAGVSWRVVHSGRPEVNGRWVAEVEYDWPGARQRETFEFEGDGTELRGSAGFLGVARGVEQGSVADGRLRFITRGAELEGAEMVRRYDGRLVEGELRFSLQIEGGSSPHVPVNFAARRAPLSAPPP
jgi:hypothetical protein